MQMSKNRPRVKARDGKLEGWNFFRRTNSKRSYLLPIADAPEALKKGGGEWRINSGARQRGAMQWLNGAVGLTGLEPVTLRLSSACSNQLSYRPWVMQTRCPRPHGGGKGIRTPDL